MLWFLLNIFLLGYSFYKYICGDQNFWPQHGVPYVHSSEMGSFWDRVLLRLPLRVMDDAVYKKLKSFRKYVKYGGIMEFRTPVLFVKDLDLIQLIMVQDFDHFLNRRPFTRDDDPTPVNQMLFAMNNSEWRDSRRELTPTFAIEKIKRVFGIFVESSQKLNSFLMNEYAKAGTEGIDMQDAFGRYAMDVITLAAFGIDGRNFENENSTIDQMGHKFRTNFSGFFGPIKLLSSLFAPKLSKLLGLTLLDSTSIEFFSTTTRMAIRNREETGEERNDFLQVLLEVKSASDEDTVNTGKCPKFVWTQEFIVAQCLAFISGGLDTIETLLIFAAFELAMNQDIQQQLLEEIEVASENNMLTFETINQMELLDQVISETLRKYPPTVRTERKCTKNYKIPGSTFEIEKDMAVRIPVWSIHHDPAFYPDPECFNPGRFSQEEKAKRHPYAYMPFGVGPRQCIGMNFALIQGKVGIAHLIRHFHFEPSSRTTIPMEFDVNMSLKPIDGMWLKVTPRQ